ncbi:hypothetical protein KFL_001810010 [Klebsormidium nitens]|uniref:C962R-like N-terminal AEP domain-containing protein n=1 Tax=Klebsormidium nitens TaxID=105231 RepID=A0A1Y1I461_KLENI|nr:hypothetical protein KFL_001810010 [Klebsormidium nitens]|eukprot:GAQ84219.1 hypothetical protein KFL_001810010 [Klebsormidium nitens]
MGPPCCVKKWADHAKLKVTRVETPPHLLASHLLLNDGILRIPGEKETAFNNLYAKWWADGKWMYVVQKRTKVFKLFVDLDYECVMEPSDNELVTVCLSIYSRVAELVGAAASRCIVSVADGTKRLKEGGFKRGVHIVWPDVCIDDTQALVLRRWLLVRLNDEFGQNSWEKVVDSNVYKGGSGLRMNGSMKMPTCEACGGRREKSCKSCGGQGKVTDPRRYAVFRCFVNGTEDEGLLETCVRDLETQISLTSIRVLSKGRVSVVIPPCDAPEMDSGQPAFRQSSGAISHVQGGDRTEAVAREIRLAFPECFDQGERIENVQEFAGSYYLAHTNSKYCNNLGRPHNSNRIYFYLSAGYMFQKCYCTCETLKGRSQGLCQHYRSRGVKMSEALRKELFPGAGADGEQEEEVEEAEEAEEVDEWRRKKKPAKKRGIIISMAKYLK